MHQFQPRWPLSTWPFWLWMVGGIYLLVINLMRMIWMVMTDGWWQALWLSQIIGILESLIWFTKAQYRTLNGVYFFCSLFPFIGFFLFLSTPTDWIFYMNHFPQFFLVVFLLEPNRVKIEGIHVGWAFLTAMLIITFYIEFSLNLFSKSLNTTASPYFPIVIGIAISWYAFCWWFFSHSPSAER